MNNDNTELLHILIDKYGVTLGLKEISEVIGITLGTVRNLHSQGELQIPTYRAGKKRYADVRDVARYLEQKREEANQEWQAQEDGKGALEEAVRNTLARL